MYNTKICTKCKTEKPLNDFGNEKRTRDGKRADCKDCYKKMKKNWIEKNPNYFKEWHENNPNYRSDVYRKNIDREKEANRIWRINNKELCRIKSAKRRQLERKLPYNYSQQDWEETLNYFSDECCYCGSKESIQQDHFIPAEKGGAFIKSNIVPACYSCNASKKDKNFEEWYSEKSFYDEIRESEILNFVGVKNNIQQLSIL